MQDPLPTLAKKVDLEPGKLVYSIRFSEHPDLIATTVVDIPPDLHEKAIENLRTVYAEAGVVWPLSTETIDKIDASIIGSKIVPMEGPLRPSLPPFGV